jgi:hypothetical protein
MDSSYGRRRRTETTVSIRKEKKEQNLKKRREFAHDEVVKNNNSSNSIQLHQFKKPRIDDIPFYIAILVDTNSSEEMCLGAIQALRRLLARERNPPVKEVLQQDGLRILLHCLSRPWNRPVLLNFEIIWALTNIASTEHTTEFVKVEGAIDQLCNHAGHIYPNIRDQAIWCLANIAGDSTELRDCVLNESIVETL